MGRKIAAYLSLCAFLLSIGSTTLADDTRLAWGVPMIYGAGGGVTDTTCAGTKLWHAHFENNDDVTIGSPAGCTDNASWTLTKTSATYTATAGEFIDGSYGLETAGTNHYSSVPFASSDLLNKGSVEGWAVRTNASYAAYLFYYYIDATHRVIVYLKTDNTANLTWDNGGESAGGNTDAVADCSTVGGAGCYVTASWDATQVNGSDKIYVRLCTGPSESGTCSAALEYTNRTMTDNLALTGVFYIGSAYPTTTNFAAVDNIAVWNDYKPTW